MIRKRRFGKVTYFRILFRGRNDSYHFVYAIDYVTRLGGLK